MNRETINDGDSNATAWEQWAFAPIRFEGMTKHVMASALRQAFHQNLVAFPYVDTLDEMEDPDWLAFVRQLGNIKAVPTRASYSSFKMVDEKRGDDLFDAAMAAVYALVTRGQASAPSVIQTRKASRESLLATPSGIVLPA